MLTYHKPTNNTALQRFVFRYTNGEYGHFLCFLAAEFEFGIHFPPARLDLAVQEVGIFSFLQKINKRILSES